MEISGHTYISGKYTPADYLRLNLHPNSPQATWNRAIDIFHDRLYGRFFKPMKSLLNYVRYKLNRHPRDRHESENMHQSNRHPVIWHPNADEASLMPNGFAVMALVCLLMETLMQFRRGLPVTPSGDNKSFYTDFLTTNLTFSPEEAVRFYKDIRCGILHSGETKNNSCLTIMQPTSVRMTENGSIKVDVERLVKQLLDYFKRYRNELKRGTNAQLRANFIKKMDSIMKKWERSPRFTELWNAIRAQRGHSFEVAAGEFRSIRYADDKLLQFDNNYEVMKVDVCEAVCFWNDVDSINSHEGWNYIVPLLNSCREISDTFIVKAG